MTRMAGLVLVVCGFVLGCGDDDRSMGTRDSGGSGGDSGGGDDAGTGLDAGDPGDAGGGSDSGGGTDGGGGTGDGGDASLPPVECSTGGGDAFEMSVCRLGDVACRYTEGCPASGLPPEYDMCFAEVTTIFGSFRGTAPDLTRCRECLDAIAAAFEGFGAMSVCPPPDEPPEAVTLKCDLDPTMDADGDGIANNDIDACGDPEGMSGGGGMGGDPGDPPPPPSP